ncbi:MAG: glycosyl hydrolase family 8 [Candidatus Brocadiaceae bacterium]|nr:glycosyl hydrolase family 8 [Candidatus Brocadiaceae bacterium]
MRLQSNVACFFLALCFCTIVHGDQTTVWEEFQSNFLTQDGRVIDYYNNQCSHSEGQGYGMLLATMHSDKKVFDAIWQWTKENIGVRGDSLFAWKWGERMKGKWGVMDYNNATDGDVLIAYALLKADELWPGNNYKDEGLLIIESVRKNLIIERNGQKFLLPGYYGFIRENGFIVNPSYIVFPAYREFAKADDKHFWQQVYRDSLDLVTKSCFGSLQLPADWIIVRKADTAIFSEKKPYFGYEAIRTFLYLSWEEDAQLPDGLERMLYMYKKLDYIPLWVDLISDGISLESAPAGFYAVFARAAEKLGKKNISKKLFQEARERLGNNKKDYYSYCLYLLSES